MGVPQRAFKSAYSQVRTLHPEQFYILLLNSGGIIVLPGGIILLPGGRIILPGSRIIPPLREIFF